MKVRILSRSEERVFDATHAVYADYADVAAATDATAVNTISVLAGAKAQVVGFKLITPFDCSGTGNLTLSVGDGDSATALMAAIQVALDGTEILYHVGGSPKIYLADDTIDLFWDTTGVAITTYDTGACVLYLKIANINDMPIT